MVNVMKHMIARRIRWFAFGAAALAVALGARLQRLADAPLAPQPLRASAPDIPVLGEQEFSPFEMELRVNAIESAVQALNVELRSLRLALEAMSPLPETTEYFIPVAVSELDDGADLSTRPVDILALIDGAPRLLPEGAFFSAVMGSNAAGSLLDADWRAESAGLADATGWASVVSGVRLSGLEPRQASVWFDPRQSFDAAA